MAKLEDTAYGAKVSAQKKAVDPFEALLARLGKSAEAVTKLEEVAKVATNPVELSSTDLRTATAEDRQVATEARRDLQQANIELAVSKNDIGNADGTTSADLLAKQEAARIADEKRRAGQSAYDLLYSQFAQYGMGTLVDPLKDFIVQGLSPAEFTLRLRDTDAYKKRFAANASRIAKGLSAIDEATYIDLEDQYQNVMRNYGLPASYYTRGDLGRQEGFEKFIANDVSAPELEDRIATAQKRVINANPEVTTALKQFYPDITNGDILAYTLDPTQGLESIKRKVTAAEIGGAAIQSGLSANLARAEELGRYGVDKAAATSGYSTIGAGLQRGSQLAAIYQESPYTQTTAEEEIFNIPGAEEARKKRQKITGLEKATFGGQTGITSGALARDRAGGY
jgi:hypothetical protein